LTVALGVTACGSGHPSSSASTSASTSASPSSTGGASVAGGQSASTTTPPTTLAPALAAAIGGSVTGPLGNAPTVTLGGGPAPTGLVYRDVVVGSGATATTTSTAVVQYVALHYATGKVFDSSWTSGAAPASFDLSSLIPGLSLGVAGMHVGGRREIVIPPAYGYGATGQGPIAANETVVFVVDLIGLTPPAHAVNAPIGGSVTGPLTQAPTIVAPTTKAPTEVTYTDIVVGAGAMASGTSTVQVRYVGENYANGKVFDSSWTSGTTPVSFALNQVIQGFKLGIAGMRVGGRREIVIPPAYGYGATANGPVAANETLLFVVDLVAVQ
jgi:peptidylprolyl isomerase